MPCYKEKPDVLLRTVDSIVDCDYPPSCMHIFLSFDGDEVGELYLNTLDQLGVPLNLKSYPTSIDVIYRDCRITVSRFKHGGKRKCQKKTYQLIDKVYATYLRRNDNMFMLFIDSDCILDRVCIQNFMYEMELKPGSKRTMTAMTGVITSTTKKNTLLTILQDMEYIHGQLFERSVESGCGSVTCLPGALTMLRFSAFRRMAKFYFADKAEQCDDLFDYGKCHLGEDRWLTHLFMVAAPERYQIQMNTGAFCKTEAVETFTSLLKQRRRWFLGFITNEVCMLTDTRLWKRYPLLLLIRLAMNTIRTTALLFFIMVIAIISTSQSIKNLPVGFIAVSLGLNWLLMVYFGAKLGRYKVMLYPIMFVVNPIMNYCYMVYGIFTAGQRTWGGPRADAGAADATTTPAQVVEQAELKGDELNVVPETFKPAVEALTRKRSRKVPLMPSTHLEGRFASAEPLAGGWFQQTNDSGFLHSDMTRRVEKETPRAARDPSRESVDSLMSDFSTNHSIHTPRRVESIIDGHVSHRQGKRRMTDSALFEAESPRRRELARDYGMQQLARSSVASVASSASSVSMHFSVPHRPAFNVPRRNQHHDPPPPAAPSPPIHSFRVSSRPVQRQRSFSDGALIPAAALTSFRSSLQPRPQSISGRSPLARKSFERVMSPPHPSAPASEPPQFFAPMSAVEVIQLERQAAAQARASLENRQASRGRRISADERRQPRKLSKRPRSDGRGG
nr:chitin synthase d [Quercus suber]